MDKVNPSSRPVIIRILRLLDVREEDDEYLSKIEELSIKPFTELHEYAKQLRTESSEDDISSVIERFTGLKTTHYN